MMEIKKLAVETSEELCAQQVITTLSGCLKQLIDNSIDAKSTKIRIYLQQYGKSRIVVQDDGCGIKDFSILGQKGSTSKNEEGKFKTLGFRGEALHSITKVSKKVQIETKTSVQHQSRFYNLTQKLLKNQHLKSLTTSGTKIQIQQIFTHLPVRRQQLLLRYKQMLKDLSQLIREVSLSHPQIQFIMILSDMGKESIIINTANYQEKPYQGQLNSKIAEIDWKKRITQIFGYKYTSRLLYLEDQFAQGFFLNKIESGSGYDNQFLKKNIYFTFLNRRPIECPKWLYTNMDSFYRQYNNRTKLMFIINLILKEHHYDVNITPDKREVLIQKAIQDKIVKNLNENLQKYIVTEVHTLQDYQKKRESKATTGKKSQNQPAQQLAINNKYVISQSYKDELAKAMSVGIKNQRKQEKQLNGKTQQKIKQNKKTQAIKNRYSHQKQQQQRISTGLKVFNYTSKAKIESKNESLVQKEEYKIEQMQKQNKPLSKEPQVNKIKSQQPQSKPEPTLQANNIILNQISEQQIKHPQLQIKTFKQFQILGQFNVGFILCLYQGIYYLIDQHAASEKYYFEKFISEKPHEYWSIQEEKEIDVLLCDSIEIRRDLLFGSGFTYQIKNRQKLIVSKGPIIHGKYYGMEHFLEIVQENKKLSQLNSYQATMASKACRTAVMVGKVLSGAEMREIVDILSSLKSPWNCPHGRPTLIQLNQHLALQKDITMTMSYSI